MSNDKDRISFFEMFGITEPGTALRDALKATLGNGGVPPTIFDLTSFKIFKPRISIPTWLGIDRKDHKVPVYNLYNRRCAPANQPYSVKVTYARDFKGGQFTYDSHIGTDFAVPVGTRVVTAAPGKVVHVLSQLDHGGLKIFVDHGDGLITTYGHLARSLVAVGDIVDRGDTIALSGAAGIEILLFFPWVAPHVHMNVILNGCPVDPFSINLQTEPSLWKGGNDPIPHTSAPDNSFTPTEWNATLIDEAIAACTFDKERAYLESIEDLELRAVETINYRMFYSTLFDSFPPIYDKEYDRRSVLDLPFRAKDYNGVRWP